MLLKCVHRQRVLLICARPLNRARSLNRARPLNRPRSLSRARPLRRARPLKLHHRARAGPITLRKCSPIKPSRIKRSQRQATRLLKQTQIQRMISCLMV